MKQILIAGDDSQITSAMHMKQKQAEEHIRRLSHVVEQSPCAIIITDRDGNIEYVNPMFIQLSGYTSEEVVGKNTRILKSGETPHEEYKRLWDVITSGRVWHGEFHNQKKDGELYWESASISPIIDSKGVITHFVAIKEDITAHKLAERRLDAQHTITQILALSRDLQDTATKILQSICECLEWDFGAFWLYSLRDNVLHCSDVWHAPSVNMAEFEFITRKITFSPGVGLPGRVWSNTKATWIKDVTMDPNFPRAGTAVREGLHSAFGFPIMSRRDVLGVMEFFSRKIRQPNNALLNMMSAIGNQIGLFIKRKQAEEQVQTQLRRLSTLREIDKAIIASLDLQMTLDVFLDKAFIQTQADAIDILLFDSYMQALLYIGGRGFRTNNTHHILHAPIKLSECHAGNLENCHAGRAVLEQRNIYVQELKKVCKNCGRTKLIEAESFVAYHGIPLISKGQVKGILEVFHRTLRTPDQEWLDFLETLGGQAAIAIDNAVLFKDLQRANTELIMAYDNTIEGWAYALDLRDKETEGHSRRVTELTLRIATTMDMSKADLVHVRRGALLHDIGKMGIPDRILLKEDRLTDEEWIIMRKHPVYAYDLLSRIAYLRQAIDIPYCHHEKWDGTGYPQGLKGGQIPLTARIFAVVDVWDALGSDRPYRKAWPKKEIGEYIRLGAGSHFDPEIVTIFMKMEL